MKYRIKVYSKKYAKKAAFYFLISYFSWLGFFLSMGVWNCNGVPLLPVFFLILGILSLWGTFMNYILGGPATESKEDDMPDSAYKSDIFIERPYIIPVVLIASFLAYLWVFAFKFLSDQGVVSLYIPIVNTLCI